MRRSPAAVRRATLQVRGRWRAQAASGCSARGRCVAAERRAASPRSATRGPHRRDRRPRQSARRRRPAPSRARRRARQRPLRGARPQRMSRRPRWQRGEACRGARAAGECEAPRRRRCLTCRWGAWGRKGGRGRHTARAPGTRLACRRGTAWSAPQARQRRGSPARRQAARRQPARGADRRIATRRAGEERPVPARGGAARASLPCPAPRPSVRCQCHSTRPTRSCEPQAPPCRAASERTKRERHSRRRSRQGLFPHRRWRRSQSVQRPAALLRRWRRGASAPPPTPWRGWRLPGPPVRGRPRARAHSFPPGGRWQRAAAPCGGGGR
mmetsp:Transcript_50737/g.169406  ORF Transcript_50737/g.169406 Transcript_50737/m.169406 type:complete len:327 (-) Transcript_50737:181-1161(-)